MLLGFYTLLGDTELVAMKCFDTLILTDFVIKIKNDISDTGLAVSLGLGSLHTRLYTTSGPLQVQHQCSLCWALNVLVASKFLKTASARWSQQEKCLLCPKHLHKQFFKSHLKYELSRLQMN